jgi:hypothetical protein
MDIYLRYYWFLMLGIVLINVAIVRRRLAKLVELGRVTQEEAEAFVRGFGFGFGIPCLALGVIALWARWPYPMCAGVLSFKDAPSSATSIVILAASALVLSWVRSASGADLLARVAPVMMNVPNWDRTYSPQQIRWAVTGIILVAAVIGVISYDTTPQDIVCVARG